MAKLLEVNHLYKDQIIKDVSFSIESGEMVAIMGPSGSGKSTLLYQVSGMDQATSGTIRLNGTAIERLSEEELARLRLRRMGFVFQQMNMLKNLTILDNILLPAYHYEKGKRQKENAKKYALVLMKKLGISGLWDRRITEVSGGQLQRACICRSMMNHPEIIFADEPTGALNRSAASEVMDELQMLNENGVTIFLVTHDSKVASKCSRVLYLVDGKIKGEFVLGKPGKGKERVREEQLNDWLNKMGW